MRALRRCFESPFAANTDQATGNDLLIASSTSLEWGTGDFYVVAAYDNIPTAGASP